MPREKPAFSVTEKKGNLKTGKTFLLKNGKFRFEVYELGRKSKDSPPPIPAVLGDPREVWQLYDSEIKAFQASLGPEYVATPFTFPHVGNRRFGDFTSIAGQRDFRHIRVSVTNDPLQLAGPMQKVRRFADMAQVLRFPKSEDCACVRDFSIVDDQPKFVIGPGPYEEVFATMNSQGLRFELNSGQVALAELLLGKSGRKELETLQRSLQARYGKVTIRQAVHQYAHGLPVLGDSVASYVLGMAAIVLTSDGYVVFGRRAKHRVSVNLGINVPTSGGFKFDRQSILRHGLPRFIEAEIIREAEEEMGITGSDCAVTVLALVRELSRAGSPEILSVIEFYGTLNDLVKRMHSNHHPEQDVDAVYALPIKEARALVRQPDATKVLQPKALLNMIMFDRYFKNGLV